MKEINNLTAVYFSPTHTGQRVIRSVAQGTGIARMQEIDLTTDEATSPISIKDSLCLVMVPVYGGLVAPTALQRIARLRGEGSVALPMVVYGNRHYEDALVQLRDALQQQGFVVLGGATFVGEHTYSRPGMPIAEGRPDDKDLAFAHQLGQIVYGDLCAQLEVASMPAPEARDWHLPYEGTLAQHIDAVPMPGNVPYKVIGKPTPQAPVVSEACHGCGDCVTVCPTHAITVNAQGMSETDINRCIKCCACVKMCPMQARTFDTPYTAMLHAKCSERREPEMFL